MFKLDIGDPKSKKTVHIETDSNAFLGKKISDVISGKDIPEVKEFVDYEFTITGASTKAGFPALATVEHPGLKRVLLTRGKGLKQKKPKGLRKRKTVHGNIIDEDIIQINLKVSKEGAKPFEEIFKKEKAEEVKEVEKLEEKPEEKKEEVKVEAKPEEIKKEVKEEKAEEKKEVEKLEA